MEVEPNGGLLWQGLLEVEPTKAEADQDESALAADFSGARLTAGELCRLGLYLRGQRGGARYLTNVLHVLHVEKADLCVYRA